MIHTFISQRPRGVVSPNSTDLGLGQCPIEPPNGYGETTPLRCRVLASGLLSHSSARHGSQGCEAEAGANGMGGHGRYRPRCPVEGDLRRHGSLQVGGIVEADADFDQRRGRAGCASACASSSRGGAGSEGGSEGGSGSVSPAGAIRTVSSRSGSRHGITDLHTDGSSGGGNGGVAIGLLQLR